MRKNSDVWAIQSDPNELETALKNIKKDGDILIYTNLLCNFKMGDVEVSTRTFDTALCSEENDIIVMLMRGGKVTCADMKAYLDKKGFDYGEVSFAKDICEYENDDSIPEIWFARDIDVLSDVLGDAKSKGVNRSAEYFPLLTGSLELGYLTNTGSMQVKIDGRNFWGLVALEDRLILLIDSPKKGAILASDVVSKLEEAGFKFCISDKSMFSLPHVDKNNEKKKI